MAFENLIIRTRSVSKSYGKETVLSDFNLDVWNGSIVGILGTSGSGKTTALRLIAGFEKPESASDGVKYPNMKRMVNNIISVTSIENISVTNIIKPNRSRSMTSIISGVITHLIFNQSNKAS